MSKVTAHKRTEGERELDLVEISGLYCKGFTYLKISEVLSKKRNYSLSRQQIYYDVKDLLNQWKETHTERIDTYLVEQLAKLDRLELEYWDGWERSKRKKKETTVKDGVTDKGTYNETSEKTGASVGDSTFLAGVERCIEKRCKLLGLHTEKIQVDTPGGFVFNLIAPKPKTEDGE